jgi:hypothetical protein
MLGRTALFLGLGFFCIVSANDVFKEIHVAPFYPPPPGALISPGGKYFANNTPEMDFEVMEIGSSLYSIRSKYMAWTSPYPKYRKPERRYFIFSPDEKYLITDNYVINDSLPLPINWIEIWDIERKNIVRQFSFEEEKNLHPGRLTYSLADYLNNYYGRSPFKDNTSAARVIFSPDGSRLFFLYPGLHIYDFNPWSEVTGTFELLGAGKFDASEGVMHFNPIGTPVFFNQPSKIIMAINGNTFIFNDFFNSSQDYYKVDGAFSHIELSRDNKMAVFGNKVYRMNFANVMAELPGNGYIDAGGSRLFAGSDFFAASDTYGKLTPFYLGDGSLCPSSTREFIYATDAKFHAFSIYDFSTGKLLQTISIDPEESLLRDTDKGNRLILKNNFTKKIRVFERN